MVVAFLVVGALIAAALVLRGGATPAEHPEASHPSGVRTLFVFRGVEPSPSTRPTLLRVQLVRGALAGDNATVLSDDQCENDAAGVSHCLNRPLLANGSELVVRHPRSIGTRVVAAAMRWLGTPYSWGGGNASGPTRGTDQGANTVGFDCAGLALYAYAQVGIGLPRFLGSQWNADTHIRRMSDLVPGDLVFFGSYLGHEGIYIGGGQMIHAPHTGDVVKISDISSGYWASKFRGGVRWHRELASQTLAPLPPRP